jgi:hypothetical protein
MTRRVVVLASLVALVHVGCRSKPDSNGAETNGTSSASTAVELPAEPTPTPTTDGVDATNRFRDAEPKVEIDPDGPVDPVCSGSQIALALSVVDRRCAISSARAKQLRAALEKDGGSNLTLRQEAKVAEDGRVTVRLVNTGTASLTLPLSFSAKLPAFTALAEDDRHTLYELEAPRFDVEPPGGPDASAAADRAHFARIVLAPGSAAVATVTILPGVVRVLGGRDASSEKCPDGGSCAPKRLASGRYALHVGELLSDVEAGPPARVMWTLP